MRTDKQQLEALFEQATAQVRAARPEESQASEAAERVWARLSGGAAEAPEIEEIRGCADYQALIPAYLAGNLTEARRVLLEDHTRSCVPCRRALKAGREGEPAATLMTPERRKPSPLRAVLPWALAASLLAGVGLALFLAWEMMPFASGPVGTVAAVDGNLFHVAASSHWPLGVDETVALGDRIRTGREGGAVVELADGSLVEMKARSELAIRRSRRGVTLDLERGSVIVEAADQRSRRLYVSTADCLVSVEGTIFSVNHGTKGSRVSVIEGEVRVDYSGEETVLLPGQQVATHASLAALPVKDEIAWSRDVGRYIELLHELAALREDLRETYRPGRRYSSRLLDLMPEGTVFYVALPNLSGTIQRAQELIEERIEESAVLSEWWEANQGSRSFHPQVEETVSKIAEFGEFLGEELVVSGQLTLGSDFGGPLVLAEVVDPAGFRDFVEREAASLGEAGDEVSLNFLDDPFAPVAGEGVFLWLHDGWVAASPEVELIRRVAETVLEERPNPFVGTAFHRRITELYDEGAEFLIAADLEQVVAGSLADAETGGEEEHAQMLERLGLRNVQHLMVEQKQALERTHHRAVLTFSEGRQGVFSWLAEPAPMGALQFISADAKLVTAAVFRDPVALLDEIYGILAESGDGFADELRGFEERHGLSLRDDFAAAIGGEFAFAVDGPLFPEPSWKLVVEVYDPARLQWTIEQALAELNVALQREGDEPLELLETESGGRTFYTLDLDPVDVHYTFVEGFLVAAPSRAMVERAIRYAESGYTLTDSSRFTALLPADRRENFSALVYHDVAALLQPLAERYAEGATLTEEQRRALEALESQSSASLAYAYGEDDRIILAAASDTDFLGSSMLELAGLRDPAGFAAILGALGVD